MESQTKNIILTIQVIIGILLIFIGGVLFSFSKTTEKVSITKCYDRFSNEIIGSECKQSITVYDDYFNNGLSMMIIGMFILLSAPLWSDY